MKIIKKYYAALTALFVFIIYFSTLAPGIVEIDSGELATVQITLGIAHPTGYPLFTLIGYLLLKIPLPFTAIYKANLLSAVWCALGIFSFMKSVSLLLEKNNFQKPVHKKRKGGKNSGTGDLSSGIATEYSRIISTICAGLMLAFNRTYWSQSTSVEVYPLQTFLIGIILYTALAAYYRDENKKTGWSLFGFFLALGFSNHMTTLLLLPFAAILFFQKEKLNRSSLIKIFYSLAAFIPVLVLLYMYLPLRASGNPAMNWGNPVSFENFFRHVSGRQYQVWLFSSLDAAKKHLGQFLAEFPAEYGYIGLIAGLTGIIYLFRSFKKLFYLLTVSFLFAVLYTVNYDIADLDSYFITAFMFFTFFIAFGFVRIFTFLSRKSLPLSLVTSFIFLFPLLTLVLNYEDVDESRVFCFEDYTRAILGNTEMNSIVFSYQWDYFVSASYYIQQVENYRKDVTVIDKELLRRSWYYNQLKRNHPEVTAGISNEINNFLSAVEPFERNEAFDPSLIENCYRSVMTNLITSNIDTRNYYIGPELFQNEMQHGEFSLPAGFQIVPEFLLFKVVRGTGYVPAPDPNFMIRMPEKKNHYTEFIANIAAEMLTYRAAYELQFNKPDRARIYISKVQKDFPEYQIPYSLLLKLK